MKQARWVWMGLALASIGAGSLAAYLALRPPALPDGVLYGNGHIEGIEVRVAAEVPGRIAEMHFEEGRRVGAGDVLTRLDDEDFVLRLSQARAGEAAAVAAIQRTEGELATAHHHRMTAENDVKRYEALAERGTVSPQRLDGARNAFEEAKSRVATLEAVLEQARAQRGAARQTAALAESALSKTTITAPSAGTIVAKLSERGEAVAPGQPLAILIDLSQVELKVYVPESEVGRIRLGAPARIRIDAFPERFLEAAVKRVDGRAQFTPRDIHMPDERVRTVFGIVLAVDNPEGFLKPGMPADAWILWPEGAQWPDRLFVPG